MSKGCASTSLSRITTVCRLFADHASAAAHELRTKCALNLASCHLRLAEYPAVVRECSEVLTTSPNERKALYRRGQAHLALCQHAQAVSDLRAALARCAAHSQVQC